ncbi:hypothetical protein [Thermoactinospora rubra]|uniref:hypothetical protein n=1 Tax=Thermoactinospora rubra TaxID=1088767 RepID=UPI000A10BD69|nr:hypothetical protein [Thermoactinospora rubra]
MIIEFAIAVAQGVVSSIIVDLMRGKRDTARKQEIEAAAASIARERASLSTEQLDEVVRKVMDEIAEIVKRNPDLTVGPLGGVKLARQVAKKNTPDVREQLLVEQLARLNDIVAQRRASLGLPLGPPRPPAENPADAVQYERIEGTGPDSELWRAELEAMKRRVHERRVNPPEPSRHRTGDE